MLKSIAEFIVSFFSISNNFSLILEYWIYNNLKIFFILFLVVFVIGFLRTYLPPEKIRDYLKGKNSFFGYFFAVILGIISPFCTCSTIPIFLGLVSAGIPFGIIITFLFISPMINFAAIVVLFSTLGIEITIAYLIGGIAIAILGSFVLVRLKMDRFLVNFNVSNNYSESEEEKIVAKERIKSAYHEGLAIVKQVAPYIFLGVTIGAGIHGLVPDEFISKYLSGTLSVPGAVLAGVPVYADIMGVIPIAESLIDKGLPIGTAVAFMMSVAALSLPQFILLKNAMQKKLLFAYGGILSIGIIFLGVLLNILF